MVNRMTDGDCRNTVFRNKLFQIGVEPWALGPIYTSMSIAVPELEASVQTEAILKFLADSRRYLTP